MRLGLAASHHLHVAGRARLACGSPCPWLSMLNARACHASGHWCVCASYVVSYSCDLVYAMPSLFLTRVRVLIIAIVGGSGAFARLVQQQ